MLKKIYQKYILSFPKLILLVLFIFVAIMFTFALKLEIDASAETLLLEGDKDLEFSREVSLRFHAQDYLILTYSISDDLLSEVNIQNIISLSEEIKRLKIVESILSIVNVPLLQSPPRPLQDLVKGATTLLSPNIDKNLVKEEFLKSPIYKQNLVSDDFKTTALLVNLKRDEKYFTLLEKRKKALALGDHKLIQKAAKELKRYRDIMREENHKSIMDIREIIQKFEKKHKDVKLHLGGVNMITDDMVQFVKHDLKTFGLLSILLLIIVLYILLKQKRWVFIALFISGVSLLITSGLLGLFAWEITIVSSNFISLQLIMNISLIVHLIIKYKELSIINKHDKQKDLLINTMLSMSKPSFFVVITTIAGFSSLVFSNILPIINFGWMMSVGIIVSLLITFLLFPVILIFFRRREINGSDINEKKFTYKLATIAYNHKKLILFLSILLVLFSITGANQLKVENSFIDYFKKDTQIYQGMAIIDKKLGGTTPLDIILTFKEDSSDVVSVNVETQVDELDEFEDEFKQSAEDKELYWFTQSKMQKIKEVHEYLDSLKAVGKVLSLWTVGNIIKTLNDGKDADSLTLALLYKKLPDEYKNIILTPYIDISHNQVRITARIIDSMPDLQRDKLLKKIDKDLKLIVNPKYEEFRTSNLLVMYNNMLQSLFKSQIKTVGVVVLILFLMFLILFRSLKIALIAIVVNTVPVGVIFGFMGWMNIPLDMMTITIAAISIGIAVDNTIHYIHRFTQEKINGSDSKTSMFNSHASIGTAMFYTSTIIIIGFSVLVFSNFLPSIYFGLLTIVAMFMAIIADLLLLPVLLLIFGD